VHSNAEGGRTISKVSGSVPSISRAPTPSTCSSEGLTQRCTPIARRLGTTMRTLDEALDRSPTHSRAPRGQRAPFHGLPPRSALQNVRPSRTERTRNAGWVALEIQNREAQVTSGHALSDQHRSRTGIDLRAVDHELLHRSEVVELVPHVPNRSLIGQGVSMLW